MPKKSLGLTLTPSVLRWAIDTSGLELGEIAADAGLDEGVIREWLVSTSRPTQSQLIKLAKALRRPVALFFLPAPPDLRPQDVAFRHPLTGARTRLNQREQVHLREAARMQRALAWIRSEAGVTIRRLPSASLGDDPSDVAGGARQMLGVGAQVQCAWRTGSEALKAWRQAFEAAGLYVFFLPLGESSARGFSLWDPTAPIIAVNTHWNNEARVFTIFHEFGHLLTKTSSICLGVAAIQQLQKEDRIERWCERFAASCLMPWAAVEEVMRNRLGWKQGKRVKDLDELRIVARSFKVSLRAAAIRLIEQKAADWNLYNSIPAWSDAKAGGGASGGRDRRKLYEDIYGSSTAKTFVSALDEDLMSRPDVLSYLKVSDSDLYDIESALR